MSARRSAIDAFVDRTWPQTGAPGLAYALTDGGKLKTGVRGVLKKGGRARVTPATPFAIGSITKTMTALAVMQLVEAGKVDLDAAIATYLPVFRGQRAGAVTVRQLLSHTSGFSTYQGNSLSQNRAACSDDLAARMIRVAGWAPAYPPGRRWAYSNTNYRILGALVQAVSGQPYARYMETHVFAPLGMHDSFVGGPAGHPLAAIGHRPWFGGKQALVSAAVVPADAPAGGGYASAADLGRYLEMMVDGRDDLLRASTKARMLRPANAVSRFYGLGWFLDEHGSGRIRRAYHDGLVPGGESLATIVPSRGRAPGSGALVLVNASSGIGFGDTLVLRQGIVARALDAANPEAVADTGPGIGAKATYVFAMLSPLCFVTSILWAWFHRSAIRAKTGLSGAFGRWFPVLAMPVLALFLVVVLPRMFGVSMATLLVFQPDFTGAILASAVLAPIWALFRVAIGRQWR